jgi:cell division transport system permease protein
MGARLAHWLTRHGHALVATAGHLSRQRTATLLTVLVMGLALALPLALQVLVRNVSSLDLPSGIGVSVYLKPEVSEARARTLAATFAAHAGIASVTLITASQALAQFRAQSGLGAALDALTDNPLPNVITISPEPRTASPAQLEALRGYLAVWPEVDSVQTDADWARRLGAWLDLLRRALLVTAALLALGVVAIVGNTIRLEIHARRAEIEVTKLVGGSNAFVRRPFLYTGVLYGLCAALIAWAIVEGARLGLMGPVRRLGDAYGSRLALAGPSVRELGALLLAGVLLGWLGAWIASTRQLSRIEPRPA